MHTMLFAR